MRNPVRSETDAFYVAWGTAVLAAAALVLGLFVAPLVGLALVVGAVIGVLIWEFATKDPQRRRPLAEAASRGRRRGAARPRGVLVIANRTLHAGELRAQLADRAAHGAEVHVVAPILTSRVHYIATDVDGELEEARRRLAEVLEWCRTQGVRAGGKVGDPLVAFGAIEDELRAFAADEVIISTYPEGHSNWLEEGIVDRLRDELDIPVTHIVVSAERASA